MLFLANVERTEFARNAEERARFAHEGELLRRLLRRARREPNGTYVIQRVETLLSTLAHEAQQSAAIFQKAFVRRQGGHSELRCYFATSRYRAKNSTVELGTLCSAMRDRGYEAIYLFLAIDEDLGEICDEVLQQDRDGIFICLMSAQWENLCALLCSELASWTGRASVDAGELSHQYVAHCFEQLIGAVCEQLGEMQKGKTWDVVNRITSQRIAWPQEAPAVGIGVDVAKLVNGRDEQVMDELNRLAQAASDFEFAAQASLWYSELPERTRSLYGLMLYVAAQGSAEAGFVHQAKINIKIDPGVLALRELRCQFVHIPSGIVEIGKGAGQGESEPSAAPQHSIWLDEFWIMRAPLTESQWAQVAPMHKLLKCGKDNHPVTDVSFLEATEFAEHLTVALQRYDLIRADQRVLVPSEVQWEKAARGTDGRDYPWGRRFRAECCNVAVTGVGGTSIVGAFSPLGDSPYGCQDRSGNVREWTRSFAGPSIRSHILYPYDFANEVLGPSMRPELQMIVRGGSFSYDAECVKCWVRNKEVACQKRGDTGIRFVIQRAT